jgi:hypothetical protein
MSPKFYRPKPPAIQYGLTPSQAKAWTERLIAEQQSLITPEFKLKPEFEFKPEPEPKLKRKRSPDPNQLELPFPGGLDAQIAPPKKMPIRFPKK